MSGQPTVWVSLAPEGGFFHEQQDSQTGFRPEEGADCAAASGRQGGGGVQSHNVANIQKS